MHEFSHQADELDNVMVDYPELLRLTLQHWHQFGPLPEDLESIRASMEHHLANSYAARRIQDYEHMQEIVGVLANVLTKFHEELSGQLTPLLEKYGLDVSIYLSRLLHQDALLRIETQL
jgi:hypothetical protein